MTDNKEASQQLLSEGILLALGSSLGYLFAFLYEWGYTSYYKIPISLINISIINVFIAIGGIFLAAWIIVLVVEAVLDGLHVDFSPDIKRYSPYIFCCVIPPIILSIIYRGTHWDYSLPWIIGLILVLLFGLSITTSDFRRLIKLLQREQKDTNHNNPPSSNSLSRLFWIFAAITTCLVVALNLGLSEAINKTSYHILRTNPEQIVLAIYGDKIICAPLDYGKKEIQSDFTILNLGDNSELRFELRETGRLHIAKQILYTPLPTPTNTAQAPTSTP